MSSTKQQVIKSVCALLCTGAFCITSLNVSKKICDMKTETAKYNSGSSVSGNSSSGEYASASDDYGFENASSEIPSDSSDLNVSDAVNTESVSSPAGKSNAASSDPGNTGNASSSSVSKSQVPSSKSEIINYCNSALNRVKTLKPGYSKHYVMNVQGSASGLVDKLKGLVTKDETSVINKGDDSTDVFPAAGFPYSSKLRESDVKTAEIKQNGQYYEITLKLDKEKNPGKGEKSSYGRVMSVIDANDASQMLKGIKSIDMTYHDGYVYAKIDSKTGNVVKAEFSASCDLVATIAVIGDISVNDIVSTETFTDFKW